MEVGTQRTADCDHWPVNPSTVLHPLPFRICILSLPIATLTANTGTNSYTTHEKVRHATTGTIWCPLVIAGASCWDSSIMWPTPQSPMLYTSSCMLFGLDLWGERPHRYPIMQWNSLLHTGTASLHCPLSWHTRLAAPSRLYPTLQV